MFTLKNAKLLVVGEANDNAEIINNQLRNLGISSSYELVHSSDEMQLKLSNANNDYDLIIAERECETIVPETVLNIIKELEKCYPVITLQMHEDSIYRNNIMATGCRDCVSLNDLNHIALVVIREVVSSQGYKKSLHYQVVIKEYDRRVNLLFESSRASISYIAEGYHAQVNKSYVELLGYSDKNDLDGVSLMDLVGSSDKAEIKDIIKNSKNTKELINLEVNAIKKDGTDFLAELEISSATVDGESCLQVILKEAELESTVAHNADIDQMTGLSTRRHLISLYNEYFSSGEGAHPMTVIYMSIDDFSNIKISVGMDTDNLMKSVSSLIQSCITKEMHCCKDAENSFIILVKDDNKDKILGLCESLIDKIKSSGFETDDEAEPDIDLSMSIGLYITLDNKETYEYSVQKAHIINQEVASSGGDDYQMHNPLKSGNGLTQKQWVEKIKYSLQNNEFVKFFQPVDNLNGHEEKIYEVVIRMKAEDGGLIMPADFLPAAEEAGLLPKIDMWVMSEISRLIIEDKGIYTYIVKMSADSLRHPDMIPFIKDQLIKYKINGSNLIFDINESSAISSLKNMRKFSSVVTKKGCRIMLSGIHHTDKVETLSKHIGINLIKFEGSLMHGILEDKPKQERISQLVDYGRNNNYECIASTIEDAATLYFVFSSGISLVQGNFLGQPKPIRNHDFT